MQGPAAYHDSTELFFRSPFGAVKCGESVTLRLRLCCAEKARVLLRTWNGDERFIEGSCRKEEDGSVFEFCFTAPEKPCVLWYNFRVYLGDGLYYVGAADGDLRSGKSAVSKEVPRDYRITVYDPAFKTPDSFSGRIAYQIFPDRFKRGAGYETALKNKLLESRSRVTVKDWHEEVDYLPRDGEKDYSPQDFYLGNFSGITEKIPYLKSLGVEVVYLNPIFLSPYNHRYSVSDYMRIDPLLGTEEDLAAMASALHENGIKLILDGVFSHTGADSVYFDRFGRYGGAYSRPDSPYREWFDFSPEYKHGYRCWWDFESLPEVEELTPSFMEFIAKVLEKWMRLGADGWRLDVADELPDEFIRFLRERIKAIDPEAILIGEVWEDAAVKKDGFGKRRCYVNGAELDGVMDYPFMEAAADLLTGRIDSARAKALLCAQSEGYPAPFMRAQLGILGSHDTFRILSRLSGAPGRDDLTREEQAVWRPEPALAEKGRRLAPLAAALQFSMPFMPCIYYGDEAGMTGLADPFCRRPYPWGNEDAALLDHYRALAAFRSRCAVMRTGSCAFASPAPDVLAILRTGEGEALTAVNRSEKEVVFTLSARDFTPNAAPRFIYSAMLGSARIEARGGELTVALPPFGFCMLAG